MLAKMKKKNIGEKLENSFITDFKNVPGHWPGQPTAKFLERRSCPGLETRDATVVVSVKLYLTDKRQKKMRIIQHL